MQKLILIYVGVKSKSLNRKYIKRGDVTDGLHDILHEPKENKFFVAIAQAIRPLKERGLLCKKGTYIGITEKGKSTAREIIEQIRQEYNDVNWDTIYHYYSRKEQTYGERETWSKNKD